MSLPSGYTRLEYIESTGTQWIDTGVYPHESRILIDADILASNTGADHHIASALWAETGGTEFYNTLRLRADRTGYAVRYYNGNLRNIEHQGSVFGRHTFDRNFIVAPYTAQVDSAEALTLTPSSVGSILSTLPLFGFRKNNGTPSGLINMRLYSCKIWKRIVSSGVVSTDLVRDFIPTRNASGVVGLWDDVNSVFYTNAGTGTFLAGELPAAEHKTLIDSTEYSIASGKCLVDGVSYSVQKGRTLVDGTGYDVAFAPSRPKIKITGNGANAINPYATVTVNGTTYTAATEIEVDAGTSITCLVGTSTSGLKGSISYNGAVKSNSTFTMTIEEDTTIELAVVTTTISGSSALQYYGTIKISDSAA